MEKKPEEEPPAPAELNQVESALETAAEQIQDGETEQAAETLETAREELAEAAEELAEQTQMSPTEERLFNQLTGLTGRMEALETALAAREVSEELSEDAGAPESQTAEIAVVQEPAEVPAERLTKRLRRSWW